MATILYTIPTNIAPVERDLLTVNESEADLIGKWSRIVIGGCAAVVHPSRHGPFANHTGHSSALRVRIGEEDMMYIA